MAEICNPRARGAPADGSANAATQWQTCLSSSNPIDCETGYYRIDTTLTCNVQGKVVQGAGRGDPEATGETGTVLGGNGVSPILHMQDERFHLRYLRFDGNGQDLGLQLPTIGGGANRIIVEHINFTGLDRWIQCPNAYDTAFEHIEGDSPLKAFDFPATADTTLRFENVRVNDIQAGGAVWEGSFGHGSIVRDSHVLGASSTTAYVFRAIQHSMRGLTIENFCYEQNACGLLDLGPSTNSQTTVVFVGGMIETSGCTGSTPALIACGACQVIMFGPLIKGTQGYSTFASIGGGSLRIVEPMVIDAGGSEVSPRTLPGMPAGADIVWHGAFV